MIQTSTQPHFQNFQKEDKGSELLALIALKDREAFDLLYENYSAALFGAIIQVVKNRAIAEDILQDCFVKIWKKAHLYNPKKGRAYTWLMNVARNTAIDEVRSSSYKAQKQNTEINDFTNQLKSEPINIDKIGLKNILDELSDKQKEVINYVYFLGYTHSEASKELNLPLGTVKTRVRTAIRDLRVVV